MTKVFTLEQAQDWFLENRGEAVLCIAGGEEFPAKCFSEAKDFFDRVAYGKAFGKICEFKYGPLQ